MLRKSNSTDGDVRIVQDYYSDGSFRGAGLINEGDGMDGANHDEPYSLLRDADAYKTRNGLVWRWYR